MKTKKMIVGTILAATTLSIVAPVFAMNTSIASSVSVINTDIEDFKAQARKIRDSEKNPQRSIYDQVFMYQMVDELTQKVYVYEDAMGIETVDVYELEKAKDKGALDTKANLPDGIGGRQYIAANGAKTLTATVKLPSKGQVKSSATPYIYAGFTGGIEADMGLQWDDSIADTGEEAWRPYVKVGENIVTEDDTSFQPGYDEVRYKNGFAPGADIVFNIDSNYNNTGKVRLKQMGYAIHANRQGQGINTYLTSIVEYKQDVSNITKFKVLATIAGTSENVTGNYTTKFSDIKLDNKIPATSAFATPEEDYAKISRSSNNITISVNR